MRFILHLAALCLLSLALPCVAATTDAVPTAGYTQNGFNPQMLDPATPQPERLKLFAHVIALANQGQVRAQNLAGTMYWKGSAITGSPVESKLDQAQILLANAAVHGDVLAMAKLAELNLQAGHQQKAMVWGQLYGHYLDPMHKARKKHGRRYAYASDLIARIEKAGGKINDKVSANVSGMVTKFNEPIRAGITAFKEQRRHGAAHLIVTPTGAVPRELSNKSGMAEFMVAFDPSGAPHKVWLIASYPTADLGTGLRPLIDPAGVNRGSDDAGMRYLLVVIPNYSNKYRELRAHHH